MRWKRPEGGSGEFNVCVCGSLAAIWAAKWVSLSDEHQLQSGLSARRLLGLALPMELLHFYRLTCCLIAQRTHRHTVTRYPRTLQRHLLDTIAYHRHFLLTLFPRLVFPFCPISSKRRLSCNHQIRCKSFQKSLSSPHFFPPFSPN